MLSNSSYVAAIRYRDKVLERYWRDDAGWHKVNLNTGNVFDMTAEQVLNHLLPAAARIKPGVTLEVTHHPDGDRDVPEATDRIGRRHARR